MANHRPRGNAAPDSATQVPQCLRASKDTALFHHPRCGPRVETSLAKALKNAAHVRASQTQRQQVRKPRNPQLNNPS